MDSIPEPTIKAFARTIFHESQKYGFGGIDVIRLINALMDMATSKGAISAGGADRRTIDRTTLVVDDFPLKSERLRIRLADSAGDRKLIEGWIAVGDGEHFLLSCATAQRHDVASLLDNPLNRIGIISLADGKPIGAVAFLDVDRLQRRAELRKLIGDDSERGKGYAEEATALWVTFGRERLGLEKIYLSSLQTHLRNIRLNESIGFRTEGVLRNEIRLGNERHDVLRMGLCFEHSAGENQPTDRIDGAGKRGRHDQGADPVSQ
jgi:RimJ/RimL family protein N-acetyltransferase